MRSTGRACLALWLILAALLGCLALAHVHDESAPGLYDEDCPSCELARNSIGLTLAPPTAAPLGLAPVVVSARDDAQVTDRLPATASSRAPPLA